MQNGTANTPTFTFPKIERLCSKSIIDDVFATGYSISTFPIKTIYKKLTLPQPVAAQVLISVPKRNFKKAVTRNMLKRHIREAYRKNKRILHEFANTQTLQYAIVFLYIGREPLPSKQIEEKIILSLQRIAKGHE